MTVTIPAKGCHQEESSQQFISVTNPITGEEVGRVPFHTSEEVIAAFERSRAAQKDWAAFTYRQRASVM